MFELQFKWVETQPNFFLFLSEKNMKCKIIIFTPIIKCYIQQLGQFWGQLSKSQPNHHNILTQHFAILLVKTCCVYLATSCNLLQHVGCCWVKYLIAWPELYSALFKKHDNNKHLMTGPEGNSEFCFPRISMFPDTKSRETLRFKGNKIHCSPRDQSLSDLLYSKTKQKQKPRWHSSDHVQQRSTFRG